MLLKKRRNNVLRELTNIGKIQEFQRKLYAKAKAKAKYRFYSLYDKTYRMDILEEAYRRAKANGGTSGVDGETFQEIEEKGVSEYLTVLQEELKQEQYKPKPVKRVYIPKANGKQRPLGIPTVRDRIVQTAFLIVLEPIFESDFMESSYGFRAKKSAHGAIREIAKYLNWGCEEIYDVDVEKYFDTVEHYKLLKLIAQRVSDGKILHVIKQWLRSGYVEDGQHKQSKRGTPQGGVISPLLANIYLNPIDKAFERSGIGKLREGSIHMIRYADDMIILGKKKLEKGIRILKHYIKRLGLSLNKEKTRKLNLSEDKKVEFLGFQFFKTENRTTKKRLILVSPSPNSLKRCRERIKKLINHKIPLKVQEQVRNANKFLTGWTGYYRLGNSSKALNKIRDYTNKRLRRLLQRNKGKSGYGWKKIDADKIYGKLGLFCNYRVQWL
ncbi:MAG: group II intron reverse transcriptase/maturase [Ignavibacteriae bacterium]|nr:group II intron reverse transcriptase/maturase [Ignavibacteriota bacterium]